MLTRPGDRLQLYDASGSWSDLTLRSGRHLLRDKISVPRRRTSRSGRGDWRRKRARGPCFPRRSPTTSMTTTTTRRRWNVRARRWRWPRSGNGSGGRIPLLVKFGSCRKMLPSGWRVATRTRTSASSTGRPGARVLRPTVCRYGRAQRPALSYECLNALRLRCIRGQASWRRDTAAEVLEARSSPRDAQRVLKNKDFCQGLVVGGSAGQGSGRGGLRCRRRTRVRGPAMPPE